MWPCDCAYQTMASAGRSQMRALVSLGSATGSRRWGGSIDVTSPAGRGTVLNVSLPIEPTSGATGASEVS